MCHAGNHEQAIELARLLRATHNLSHRLVVVDVALRRDRAVRPADVLYQLPAALLEGLEIRVDRTEDRFGANLGLMSILFDAERVRGPPRIGKHDVLEIVVAEEALQAEGRVTRTGDPHRPVGWNVCF